MTEPIATAITNTDPNSCATVYCTRLGKPWKISEAGIKFLEGWEKFAPTIYDNDGSGKGNATVGYGHLVHLGKISGAASEKPFEKGLTEPDAEKFLRRDVLTAERIVNNTIQVALYQYEYDALVCFTYNLQDHGAALLDFVNTGAYNKVGDKIRGYSHSGKTVVKGLLRRRHREAEMFEAGVYDSSH